MFGTRSLESPAASKCATHPGAPVMKRREIRSAMEERHLFAGGFDVSQLPDEQFVRATARHIAEGDIVGWFSGRAEWGPRL